MIEKEMSKETSELLITIQAPKKEWQEKQEQALQTLAKNLEIKGFRKGNVPPSIAKKSISQQDIFAEGLKNIIRSLAKSAAGKIEKEFVLDGPTYTVNKLSNSELEVKFAYPVYPEIKLPDYKNLGVKLEQKGVVAKDVEEEIQKLQNRHSLLVNKEGKIENGDVVKLDFKGTINGAKFKGGEAKNHELEIGSKRFVPGFEDQMVGLEKGQVKDLNVTFPKEYHAKNLAGKEVVFNVKINNVLIKQKPKLDNDFVKELKIKNVKTVEELKQYLKKQLGEQRRQSARVAFKNKAFEAIFKKLQFTIPRGLVLKETENVKKQFETSISKQGLDTKKYLEVTKQKQEDLTKQWQNQALKRLRDSFVFAEIAKAEKIKIVPEDYEKEYVKLAKVYNQDEKQVRELIKKEQMQIPMTNDRVIDKLIAYHK